uniref:Uncharacterized protein n=1 Tax=Marseillevirus sp. TaxID=2809551 RepID=A0AA96ENT4_9VIRU|nr:hypothetical protein MarFTMF_413 [Marseillevirus sp.]
MEFFLSSGDFSSFCVTCPDVFETREENHEYRKNCCATDFYEVERLLKKEFSSEILSLPFQQDETGIFSRFKETTSFIRGTDIKQGPFRRETVNVARLSRHPYNSDTEIRGKTRIVVEGNHFQGQLHGKVLKTEFIPYPSWEKEVPLTKEVAFYIRGHLVHQEKRPILIQSNVGYFEKRHPLFS